MVSFKDMIFSAREVKKSAPEVLDIKQFIYQPKKVNYANRTLEGFLLSRFLMLERIPKGCADNCI